MGSGVWKASLAWGSFLICRQTCLHLLTSLNPNPALASLFSLQAHSPCPENLLSVAKPTCYIPATHSSAEAVRPGFRMRQHLSCSLESLGPWGSALGFLTLLPTRLSHLTPLFLSHPQTCHHPKLCPPRSPCTCPSPVVHVSSQPSPPEQPWGLRHLTH